MGAKDAQDSTMLDFLRVICLCHDVTRVKNAKGESFLTGPSQDELCLLDMCKKTGLAEFVDRNSTFMTIRVQGQLEEYKSVKFFDFTSARKMMTRVVQNTNTGQLLVISKGADQAILSRCIPRLALIKSANIRQRRDQGVLENLDQEELDVVNKIEMFAAQGFRTLTFAMKELDLPEWKDGEFTQEDIESCYSLLGATCVEDLLQFDVARCLVDFKRAGIQTWMLTGDKGKTARMIGIQCGMLTPQQKQIQNEENKQEIIDASCDVIENKDVKKPMNKISSINDAAKEEVILYEVDEDTEKNPQDEIKKIMQLAQSR